MPSSVGLWCGGYRRCVRDDAGWAFARRAGGSTATRSAARPGTARRGCRSIGSTTRCARLCRDPGPVTAVQLSRGKGGGRHCCSRSRCCSRILGRLAGDLLLFYTQEFAYVALARRDDDRLLDHAAEAQPRRARTAAAAGATAQACLDEMLGITAKLPSGYQRDLQRLKPPVFPRRSTSRATASTSWLCCSRACVSGRRTSGWTTVCTPRRKRTGWYSRRACRFARLTGPCAEPVAKRTLSAGRRPRAGESSGQGMRRYQSSALFPRATTDDEAYPESFAAHASGGTLALAPAARADRCTCRAIRAGCRSKNPEGPPEDADEKRRPTTEGRHP